MCYIYRRVARLIGLASTSLVGVVVIGITAFSGLVLIHQVGTYCESVLSEERNTVMVKEVIPMKINVVSWIQSVIETIWAVAASITASALPA
jgi:hypothetical protein